MIEYCSVERWRWQFVLQHHLMNSMTASGAGRTVVMTGGISPPRPYSNQMWIEKVRQTRLFHCRCEKSSRREVKWESEVDSTFPLPLWKVESLLDFYSAVVKNRVYTRLFHCRCEESSLRKVKWENEVDSTFTQPLWKVESERSEVRKWGRLDFYSAVVKSQVYTRLFHCRCEKSSRREVKWESEVDSTFTQPLWKVESERSEVRKWGRLDFYSAVVKSRVHTRLFHCRCEKSSRREVKWESEVDSTFTPAVVKSRVGEKWSEKVR